MSDIIGIERKITFQTFGKPTKEAKEVETHVMRIIGFVDSYQIETGTYGDFPILFGDFLAINSQGGKARAGKAIFPMFVVEQFRSALEQGQTRIEIGVEVGTRPGSKGNTGYEWVVTPLFVPKPEEDPLLKLAAKVPAQLTHKATHEEPAKAKAK